MRGIVTRMETLKQSWSGSGLALEVLECIKKVDECENTEFQQLSGPVLGLEFARDTFNVIIDEQCSALVDLREHADQFLDLYGYFL